VSTADKTVIARVDGVTFEAANLRIDLGSGFLYYDAWLSPDDPLGSASQEDT
jgi:hypothetical protein